MAVSGANSCCYCRNHNLVTRGSCCGQLKQTWTWLENTVGHGLRQVEGSSTTCMMPWDLQAMILCLTKHSKWKSEKGKDGKINKEGVSGIRQGPKAGFKEPSLIDGDRIKWIWKNGHIHWFWGLNAQNATLNFRALSGISPGQRCSIGRSRSTSWSHGSKKNRHRPIVHPITSWIYREASQMSKHEQTAATSAAKLTH